MTVAAWCNGKKIIEHEGSDGLLFNEKWLALNWSPDWTLVIRGNPPSGFHRGWDQIVLSRKYPTPAAWTKGLTDNWCRYLAEGYT